MISNFIRTVAESIGIDYQDMDNNMSLVADLDLDSIESVHLLADIENVYGVRLAIEEMQENHTISDFFRVIINKKIRKIIGDLFYIEERDLVNHKPLFSMGLIDSRNIFQLIIALEDAFNLELNANQFLELESVDDIVDYISKL